MIDGAQEYIERDTQGRVTYSASLQAKFGAIQALIEKFHPFGSIKPAGLDIDYFIVQNIVQAQTYDILNGWNRIDGSPGGLENVVADTLGVIDANRRFWPTPNQMWLIGCAIACWPVSSGAKFICNLFHDTGEDTLLARAINATGSDQLMAAIGAQLIITEPYVTTENYALYVFNGGGNNPIV